MAMDSRASEVLENPHRRALLGFTQHDPGANFGCIAAAVATRLGLNAGA